MKHSYLKKGAAVLAATTLVMSFGAASAYAANMSTGTPSENTSWTAPTNAKSNTIVKDGKLCKVITEWSNAWASNGADYLGVSNSAWLQGNGGGDFATDQASMNKTLAGVWSSSVNESPNPYNWNTFYNMFADEEGYDPSDTATVLAEFSTETGVYQPLKYRPEMVWYSNSFAKGTGDTAVEGAVAHINKGEYVSAVETSGSGREAVTTVTYEGDASKYYIEGDESYDPTKIVAGNGSPLRWVTSLNTAAHEAEAIIDDTADYNADGAVTSENVSWKTANALPRASRYNEDPVECAVNVEKVTKGSVYYVLDQIAQGNVEKKKVAFVEDNALSTDTSTVTVVVFDYTEQVGQGKMQGTASFSPLAVDQLTTESVKTARVANSNTGGANLSGAPYGQASQDLPYTEYLATADELLTCDYIYDPNGASADAWKAWLTANATDYDETTCDTEIITTAQCIMQTSNFTSEKLAYGVFAVNSFYPELFPNMSLLSYWYDNVYHINSDSVATVMNWSCANATITKGNELSGLSNYSEATLESDFQAGLDYYEAIVKGAKDTEGTVTRVLSGLDLDGGTNPGSTTESTLIGGSTIVTAAGAWNFTDFTPSTDWAADGGYATVSVADVSAEKGEKATVTAVLAGADSATYRFCYSVDGGTTWTQAAKNTTGTVSVTANATNASRQWKVIATTNTGQTVEDAFTISIVEPTVTVSVTPAASYGAKATVSATVDGYGVYGPAKYKYYYSADGGVTWVQAAYHTRAYWDTDTQTVTGNGTNVKRMWKVVVTFKDGRTAEAPFTVSYGK